MLKARQIELESYKWWYKYIIALKLGESTQLIRLIGKYKSFLNTRMSI